MNKTLKTIFGVYVFAYSFFFAARPLSDGDFWWHLKAGEYIVKEYLNIVFGFIDWREPFDRYGVEVVIVAPK